MKNIFKIIILLILPIYSFISWIFIYNKSNITTQSGRVSEFRKFLFDININLTYLSLINILLSMLAIILLLKFSESKSNRIIKISRVILIIIAFLTLFFNIIGLV
jgi:hypothetical protein